MSDETDKGLAEQDPTEEVRGEAGNALQADCALNAGDEQQGVEDTGSFREEIGDAYQPEPDFMVPGPDGLPIPAKETSILNTAPPFTIDHVVCIEDERQWVESFSDDVDWGWIKRFSSIGFLESVDARQRFAPDGKEQDRRVFAPSQVEKLFGQSFARLETGKYVPVQPIRERCVHYKRQVLSNDAEPDPEAPGHRIIFRNCTARRSIGGAFLSLRDEAVYACDYRDPVDRKSLDAYVDGPDRERLKSEAHKKKLPLFKIG